MTGKTLFGNLHCSLLALGLFSATTAMAQQCVTCSTSIELGSGQTIMNQQQASAGSGAGSFISAVGLMTPANSVLQPGNTYLAWCVDDPQAPLNDPAFATAYSTANIAALPSDYQNMNWPKVNWVLNNRSGYGFEDVQRVIWQLIGKPDSSIPFPATSASTALLAAANANGASFVSGPGQQLAILLYQDGVGGIQDTIVEVTLPSCGTIGSLVWSDTNGNGIQDSGEPGINNVAVTLTAYDNTVLTTTTSTINGVQGSYYFNNLCSGTYTVRTNAPGSATASPSNVGSDRGIDSNGSPAVVTLDLATKPVDLTIDFGFVPVVSDGCTGSVGDFVWFDTNGNGIQDAGEFGLGGVTVNLAGSKTAQVTTAANGSYKFSNLCGGTYTVSVVNPSKPQSGRPGLAATITGGTSDATKDSNANPSALVLGANTSNLTQDFGFRSIGGCTLTQGYWKTHSTVWPVTSLYLGGKSYSATELLSILNTAVKGDVSIALAYQLIAAKLNLYSGSAVPSGVASWILQADTLLATYSGKIPLKVGSNASMTSLGSSLDSYNNGLVSGTSHCN